MEKKTTTKKFLKSKTTRKEILNFIASNGINQYCIFESSLYYEIDYK